MDLSKLFTVNYELLDEVIKEAMKEDLELLCLNIQNYEGYSVEDIKSLPQYEISNIESTLNDIKGTLVVLKRYMCASEFQKYIEDTKEDFEVYFSIAKQFDLFEESE